MNTGQRSRYRVADFSEIPGVPCPCGTARRAFTDVDEFPGTIHVTDIVEDARLHYHTRLTETYYFFRLVSALVHRQDFFFAKIKAEVNRQRH